MISACTEAAGPVRKFERMRAGKGGVLVWDEVPVRTHKMQERYIEMKVSNSGKTALIRFSAPESISTEIP